MDKSSDLLKGLKANWTLLTSQLKANILFQEVKTVSLEYGIMMKEFATLKDKAILDL